MTTKLVKLVRECKFVDETFQKGTLGELIPEEKSAHYQACSKDEFGVSNNFSPVILNGKERLLMAEEFEILIN